jgi:hypothetical protein
LCAWAAAERADALAADAVAYKGAYETGDGEERAAWAAAPALLNELGATLRELSHGRARAPTALVQRAGRTAVRVFPSSLFDHLLFSGFVGELYLAEGGGRRLPVEKRAQAARLRFALFWAQVTRRWSRWQTWRTRHWCAAPCASAPSTQ